MQREGEEPDASLATGNHDGLAVTGRLWREAQGTHSTQTCSGPALSPLGAAWPCHVPHGVTPQHRGSKQPELAAGGRAPRGAAKGLLGVKPGEFGTAERKSRPVWELGTEPPARSPAAPRWQWPTGTGTLRPVRTRGLCPGGHGRLCTHNSAQSQGKKCKIIRSHPRLSNRAPLGGNLAHSSPHSPAKSCWERGFTRGLQTPRIL